MEKHYVGVVTKIKLIIIALILLTGISGCARAIILHPIEKSDIVAMTKGAAYAPEKDGWFLSDYYFKKVIDAKVQK